MIFPILDAQWILIGQNLRREQIWQKHFKKGGPRFIMNALLFELIVSDPQKTLGVFRSMFLGRLGKV